MATTFAERVKRGALPFESVEYESALLEARARKDTDYGVGVVLACGHTTIIALRMLLFSGSRRVTALRCFECAPPPMGVLQAVKAVAFDY